MSLDHQEPITPIPNLREESEPPVAQDLSEKPATMSPAPEENRAEGSPAPFQNEIDPVETPFLKRRSTKIGAAAAAALIGVGALSYKIGSSKGSAEHLAQTIPTATASAQPPRPTSLTTSPAKNTSPSPTSIPSPEASHATVAGTIEDATGTSIQIPASAESLIVSAEGDNGYVTPEAVKNWLTSYYDLYQANQYTTLPNNHNAEDLTAIMTNAKAIFTPELWKEIDSTTNTTAPILNRYDLNGNTSIFNRMQILVNDQLTMGYRLSLDMVGEPLFNSNGSVTVNATEQQVYPSGNLQSANVSLLLVFKPATYTKADGAASQVWLVDGIHWQYSQS